MNLFAGLLLVLTIGFLFWKGWLWLSWEIEKRIFFRSVRHFLGKPEEKKPISGKESENVA